MVRLLRESKIGCTRFVVDTARRENKNGEKELQMSPETLVKQQLEGVAIGLKEFRSALTKSVKDVQPLLR